MLMIILIKPSEEYISEIENYRDEHIKNNGKTPIIGASGLEKFENIEEWIKKIRSYEHFDTVPEGRLPATTLLTIRKKDKKMVGIVNIRHSLDTEYLFNFGGHIGYSVRGSERGKGYGKEQLKLTLDICKEMGIAKVLITCNDENVPSAKAIEANGGILEKISFVENEMTRRYWINL
ncbi:GNAT family N-acetyltransferase [Erysipelothrix sp. HDW6A]|nr:GNAT family N-acetyltransferase [Erysipelothrix sp. HDW6A]